MRLVGYVRVSKVGGREGDSFISPGVQRETIEYLAKAKGHTVVGWFEDLDVSGGTMTRPGIESAIAMVEAGGADGIIVAKLDRFSRSVKDTEAGIERLEAAGGSLVAVDVDMDTSTDNGKLMRRMLSILAEWQRDRIRTSWKEANGNAMSRGIRSGGVPIGYERDDAGRFVPSADADGVRRLFQMRAEGDSWAIISRELERTTGKTWGHSTMRRIVRNPVYLGELRRGEIVSPHQHEALVDRATFEAAQGEPGTNRGRAGTLLGGLIRCASCGHAMAHESGGKRGYRGYRCFKLHAGVTCATGAKIGAEAAERYVTEQFLSWASTVSVEADTRTDELDSALERLAAAEGELGAYVQATSVSAIGADAFNQGLSVRQQAVEKARSEVAEARRDSVSPLAGVDIGGVWDSLTTREKSRLLRSAIERVDCRKATTRGRASNIAERLTIYWAGESPS